MTHSLPTLTAGTLFHIGTLDPEHKGHFYSGSHEGHGVSVSHCPHAWCQIAKLGGSPLWEVTKAGAQFVDVHGFMDTPVLRRELSAWALLNGYATAEPRWKAWYQDEEDESYSFSLHASLEEAENESTAEPPEDEADTRQVSVLVATEALGARVGGHLMPNPDATEQLLMVWLEDMHPEIDGVWWAERYNPDGYSAPRAAIFPAKLGTWAKKQIPWAGVEDVELARPPARRVARCNM